MAPPTGFEPVTYRLTAGRSTTELQGIIDDVKNALNSLSCFQAF